MSAYWTGIRQVGLSLGKASASRTQARAGPRVDLPVAAGDIAPVVSPLSAWAVAAVLLGPGVELEWSAPDRCPTAANVLADVDRMLGERRLAVTVAVKATLVAGAGGFAATVTIDRSAPRSLHARGCAALARAVALMIAVAVDQVALAGQVTLAAEAPPPVAPPTPLVPDPPAFTAPDVGAPRSPTPASPAPAPPVIAPSILTASDPLPGPPAERRHPAPPTSHALGVRGGPLLGATRQATGSVVLA